MTARSADCIDQPSAPEGRTRCHHDLLDGECAWCLGHGEVADLPGGGE